ncbi:synaptobrevin-domain-containing protein [Polychytrium aggregatum]|uniref:synaptobrevin-domain-containing protein n=1 Tax=Polychytrium aggregatum TaxID=110093 RepID=UPI0022FEC354|nr:synaptobrevin-domain-containing protein [Polychytrium aggregatum]KAI9204314.1 synaptobrevin-domain-containing protein [Polychytrium aggregatum]
MASSSSSAGSSIIYGLVARGPVILAEHATSTGNFTTITQHILEKIPQGDSKLTYVYDRYLFHYIQRNGIIYLCLADDTFGRRIPFAFLEDIAAQFETTYGARGQTAIAYGLNEFSKTIAARMEYFSANPEADSLRRVQGEIDQVRDVMVHNIEKVLERGERIEILVDKTESLNATSFAFKKRSTALRRAMWWKNTKLMAVLAVVAVLLVYVLIGSVCGLPAWGQCFAK